MTEKYRLWAFQVSPEQMKSGLLYFKMERFSRSTEGILMGSLIWLEMKAQIRRQQKPRFAGKGSSLLLKDIEV